MPDTGGVNGIGIGTATGLGAIIGIRLGMPTANFFEYIASFAFYAFMSGGLFELYRVALNGRLPLSRR